MKRREKRGGKREEGGERVDGEWTLWPFQFSSQTDIQHCKVVVVLKITDSWKPVYEELQFSGDYKMTNGSRVRKLEWAPRCHGCEVESGESTETHSPEEACRGWQRVNDSTRSSAMSDVFEVLFTFLVHFWLVIRKSDPHWLFTKWSSFELSLAGQTLLAPLDFTAPTSNFV